jgi:hypothetical protein
VTEFVFVFDDTISSSARSGGRVAACSSSKCSEESETPRSRTGYHGEARYRARGREVVRMANEMGTFRAYPGFILPLGCEGAPRLGQCCRRPTSVRDWSVGTQGP